MAISHSFFEPGAVAVIGASSKVHKIGHQIIKNVVATYLKPVYPINPKGGKILGRQVLSSIDLLPLKNFSQLLVVIVIPADFVVAEVKKAAVLGVKNFVIISSGFRESGLTGKIREDNLKSLANEYGLNILGPNCLGFISQTSGLNLSFASSGDLKDRKDSGLAFLSQSGAIGSAALDKFKAEKKNFSLFVSLGNEACLSAADLLPILAKDKKIKAVFLYLEQIVQGQKFVHHLSQLTRVKPVFILKAGSSLAGGQAAQSHTGAIASSSKVIDMALDSAGAIKLDDLDDFWQAVSLSQALPAKQTLKSGLTIVSNAGGPAVLAVEASERSNLFLPQIKPTLAKSLKKQVPQLKNINNPLDLLGDADPARYESAWQILGAHHNAGAILNILSPQTMSDPETVAKKMVAYRRLYPQVLMLAAFMGGQSVARALEIMRANNIPTFSSPEAAVKAWAHLSNYYSQRKHLKVFSLPALKALKPISGPGLMDYLQSLTLLKQYGVPILKTEKYNPQTRLSFPLALKAVGPQFVHKSDLGAIFLNIKSVLELNKQAVTFQKTFKRQLAASANYLLVQEMRAAGRELIIGLKRDPSFGTLIMVGQGGIYSEVYHDVRLSFPLTSAKEALGLVKSLKIYPILNGARHQEKSDLKALVKILLAVSKLATDHPEISELDINPLFVYKKGVFAADVRIIIS